MDELPLVSFCITCHNQAKYIRAAFESALVQDYPNVEVVISDNASTDDSRDVVTALVAEFSIKYPSRAIITNFNVVDIGIIKNFEKCFSLAHGEIFIEADGDDISLPTRASEIVAAWNESQRRATVFLHRWYAFDEKWEYDDIPISDIVHDLRGAAMAYSRGVYDKYGPITEEKANPDSVWSYRALHLPEGCGIVIQKPLIRYRLGGVTTFRPYAKSYVNIARFSLHAVRQLQKDIGESEGDLLRIGEWAAGRLTMLSGRNFRQRLSGFFFFHKGLRLCRSFVLDVIYLLPKVIAWPLASIVEDFLYPHRLHGKPRLRVGD